MADLADKQTHIVFVGAAVIKNGKILVGKRSLEESHEPGKWALIGGKIDQTSGDFEHILEKTLEKEVFEEIGIKIGKPKYIYSTTFIRSTGHHVIAMLFLCPWKSGKGKLSDEVTEIKWVSKKEFTKMPDLAHGTLDSLKIAFKWLPSATK